MLYAGLHFDTTTARRLIGGQGLKHIGILTLSNCILLPTLVFLVVQLLPIGASLKLALTILACFPCAPVVPSLVAMVEGESAWAVLVLVYFSAISLASTFVFICATAWLDDQVIRFDMIGQSMISYVLLVYGGMLTGILIRLLSVTLSRRAIQWVKPVFSLSLVVVLITFGIDYSTEFTRVGLNDLAFIFLFELVCLGFACMFGQSLAGPFNTRLFTTAFRNVALAISFVTIVLARPDAAVYIFYYMLIAVPMCLAFVFFRINATKPIRS